MPVQHFQLTGITDDTIGLELADLECAIAESMGVDAIPAREFAVLKVAIDEEIREIAERSAASRWQMYHRKIDARRKTLNGHHEPTDYVGHVREVERT